tara:strand:- start:160 stop:387 length:228 start_codon:yes stop_codon:yes gene_type:complete
VVVVLDLLLAQQQQVERVQFVMQDQHGKIQHPINMLDAKLVQYVLVVQQRKQNVLQPSIVNVRELLALVLTVHRQ